MDTHTFIIIGRSGCGKGTQAKLLIDFLSEKNPTIPLKYLESGDKFRSFLKEQGYTQELSRAIMHEGRLQPSFLAVHIWSHILIESMEGNEHLILDGTPRTLPEAMVLDSAMEFYSRTKPTVLYLDVSREWSRARLSERKRADDVSSAEVEKRLGWFDTEVMPALTYLKNHPLYTFLTINGEQSIEDVHKEILIKSGLQ
jgi:adenylate kinase family enzyme